MPAENFLADELEDLHLEFSPDVLESLSVYLRELEHWNRSMNLTGLTGRALVRRLVAEPAWIGQQLRMSGRLMDVGSGNGSPGIPLYSTCSLTMAHLIEARSKRAAFLRHVIGKLRTKNLVVEHLRIEALQRLETPVDWITLQAVRYSTSLGMVLRRFSKPSTKVVWLTSQSPCPAEGAEALNVPGSKTQVWVFRLDQSCPAPS